MILQYLTRKVMEMTDELNKRGPAELLTISDYASEMQAETGEFADAIKKWRRMMLGFKRKRNPPSEEEARQKMEDEAGDMFMCFLRVCAKLELDPLKCIAGKYNRILEEEELDIVRMGSREDLIALSEVRRQLDEKGADPILQTK